MPFNGYLLCKGTGTNQTAQYFVMDNSKGYNPSILIEDNTSRENALPYGCLIKKGQRIIITYNNVTNVYIRVTKCYGES